ncbi:MAG: hypothetical protein M5U09_18675 [Gammaproteobacteria bacterium]|nr:hypothetical protein [Gammaproteobacteria bacterium]
MALRVHLARTGCRARLASTVKTARRARTAPTAKAGANGRDVDPKQLADLIAKIDAMRKEFEPELKRLGQDVTKMGVELTALKTKLDALSGVVDDHEAGSPS